MATLVATTPTLAGVASPGAGVAASDVIPGALLGSKGAYLEILNAGVGVDNMTISDFGKTQAGNALSGNSYAASVTNGTNKVFKVVPEQGDPASNGQVTVTHSQPTGVSYKLYPLG